jgi:hypothetical protein
MNWETGTAVAEIVSAVGVIASLIYLARQMSQANQTAKTAVVSAVQQKYNDFYTLVLSNPDIAELSVKFADPDYKPNSEIENRQMEMIVTLVSGIWFTTQSAYDQGQIDENSYRVYSEDVSARLTQWPALKPYFQNIMALYPSAKDKQIFEPLYN